MKISNDVILGLLICVAAFYVVDRAENRKGYAFFDLLVMGTSVLALLFGV